MTNNSLIVRALNFYAENNSFPNEAEPIAARAIADAMERPATPLEIRRSDKKLVATVDKSRLGEAVTRAILEAGIKVILLNTYNGKGKDATDDDRQAALDKKLAAWYRGEFNVVERGDSFRSIMREAFYAAEAERLSQSVASVEKSYNKLIDDTLPKPVDGKAVAKSVDNLFLTVATVMARTADAKTGAVKSGKPDEVQAILAKVEAKYSKLAETLAASRSGAAAALDLSGIEL